MQRLAATTLAVLALGIQGGVERGSVESPALLRRGAEVVSVPSSRGKIPAVAPRVRVLGNAWGDFDPACEDASGGSDFDAFAAWASRDPVAAGAWLRDRLHEPARTRMLAAVVARGAESDPRAAAEFARSLPVALERLAAMEQVAARWVAVDPAALSEWARDLPAGPELDPAAAALATLPALAEHRADVALGWADDIVDEQLREQSVRYVLDAAEGIAPDAYER